MWKNLYKNNEGNFKFFLGSDIKDPHIIENEEEILNYPPDKIITCPKSLLEHINYKNYKDIFNYNFNTLGNKESR